MYIKPNEQIINHILFFSYIYVHLHFEKKFNFIIQKRILIINQKKTEIIIKPFINKRIDNLITKPSK